MPSRDPEGAKNRLARVGDSARIRSGYEVFGVDESGPQITQVRQMAAALASHLPADNFRVEPVERMTWESAGTLSADFADYAERKSNQEIANSRQQTAVSRSENTSGFDVVLSSAVLHFARDEQQWQAMVNEMWRVLKPGRIFFARLASTIGMEDLVEAN